MSFNFYHFDIMGLFVLTSLTFSETKAFPIILNYLDEILIILMDEARIIESFDRVNYIEY